MTEEKTPEFQKLHLSEEEIKQTYELMNDITRRFEEMKKTIASINQSLSQIHERTKKAVEYCRQMLEKSKEREERDE